MALTVREKSIDPELRAVAYDIATSQQQQMGQMYAWLVAWGLPQRSRDKAMAWMSDPSHSMAGMNHGALLPDGRMPGMATQAKLVQLSQRDGVAAEQLFLELMIAHHQAGIAMADAILVRTDRPEVIRLARAIQQSQTTEVTAMKRMLAARNAQRPAAR